jgi:hypothetical protein
MRPLNVGSGCGNVDFVFLLLIIALYAGTHLLIWALGRLGNPE